MQANHYNGRGERVRKVAGALDRRFAYDESGRLLGEFDAGGAPLQLFVWMDDQPVAVVEGTALRYVETDHLNTPRALIDPARNVPVWRWDLQVSAFGEHAANEDPDADGSLVKFNLRFPGQYLDAETGLHYNYFRDYEPGTGRYVESDPLGLLAGFATFRYADASPLRYIDPTGENAAVAGGALIGGGLIVVGCHVTGACEKFADACRDLASYLSDDDEPDCEEASPWQLKKAGISDPHAVKDEHGAKPWSRFDLCACSDGSIVIKPHGMCNGAGPVWDVTRYRWK